MKCKEIYNVLPEPFWEEARKVWRVDYRGKTFRSLRSDPHTGKPLTAKQMQSNVLEQIRLHDWSITGNPNLKVRDLVPDWCTFLGYQVISYEGAQKQKCERYEKIVEIPRIGHSTFDQYYRNFKNHVLPVIGSKRIGDVTREDIKGITDKMLASNKYNSSSVGHIRKTSRQFFEWQRIECKSIKENPVHDIQIKSKKLNRERRSGEPEELQHIFDLMKYSHLLYACKFVCDTGLRPEEVCGMPEDYDYSSGTYYVSEVVTRRGEIKTGGKTDNAERNILLSDFALADIKAQREMKYLIGINSTWLFSNAYGKALNSKVMSDAFRKYARMAGSDLTLYELRHTATTIMAEELSDRDLKGTLGHSKSMDTHGTYDHQLRHNKEGIRAKINLAYKNYNDSGQKTAGAKIIDLKRVE